MNVQYSSIIKSVRFRRIPADYTDLEEIEESIVRLPKGHNWGSVYIDFVSKSANSYAKCIKCDYEIMYDGWHWVLPTNPANGIILSCREHLMDEALK